MKLEYNLTFRQKDKGWQVIVSYKDLLGKWRQKSKQGFATKKLARLGCDAILSDIQHSLSSVPIAPELIGISLYEFSELVFHNRNLTYTSILAYRHAMQNYGTALLKKAVQNITYLDIQRAMRHWEMAPATKTLNIRCLKMVLAQAVEPYHLRDDNPARFIQIPRQEKKRHTRAITRDELKSLLTGLKESSLTYYTVAAIAAYAGLRHGEIMGLAWNDVDFKKQVLYVTKQYGRIGHGKVGIKPIKNGSNGYRTVPLPYTLLRILQEYKRVTPISLDGRIFYMCSYHSGCLNYAIQKIIPDISVHILRHTYATMLLANGQDIKTVAALIGDDVNTVLKVYIDYTEDMRKNAADAVQKIFA